MDQYFISPKRYRIYSSPPLRNILAVCEMTSGVTLWHLLLCIYPQAILHAVTHMIRKIMGWPSGVCIDVKLSLCFCVSERPVDSKGHISNEKVNVLTISMAVYVVYVSLDNLVIGHSHLCLRQDTVKTLSFKGEEALKIKLFTSVNLSTIFLNIAYTLF